MSPRKETSLGESLAKSRPYNPIRDSGGNAWRESRIGLYARLLAKLSPRLVFLRRSVCIELGCVESVYVDMRVEFEKKNI